MTKGCPQCGKLTLIYFGPQDGWMCGTCGHREA